MTEKRHQILVLLFTLGCIASVVWLVTTKFVFAEVVLDGNRTLAPEMYPYIVIRHITSTHVVIMDAQLLASVVLWTVCGFGVTLMMRIGKAHKDVVAVTTLFMVLPASFLLAGYIYNWSGLIR